MKHRRVLRLASTPWISAWLLVILLAHALVPAGYMPGPHGLMLCPAYAGRSVDHDSAMAAMGDMPGMDMLQHGSAPGDHGDKQTHHDFSAACPFAAAAFGYAGPPTLGVALHRALQAKATDFFTDTSTPRGTIVPSPLPRGPPSVG